ncbi:hypothetical protein FNH09_02650 [Streptomyces adustus]|uniref:Tox-PL domain-containing protein n=1 Tax=Streptomyces adustus TaxID=1609272 RepID=A0A5N8V8D7_9ACTN|nr:hypothetical protein [Streptomyces adustus]MPY30245.1 hypothetical protein [Streptomyces adustus]
MSPLGGVFPGAGSAVQATPNKVCFDVLTEIRDLQKTGVLDAADVRRAATKVIDALRSTYAREIRQLSKPGAMPQGGAKEEIRRVESVRRPDAELTVRLTPDSRSFDVTAITNRLEQGKGGVESPLFSEATEIVQQYFGRMPDADLREDTGLETLPPAWQAVHFVMAHLEDAQDTNAARESAADLALVMSALMPSDLEEGLLRAGVSGTSAGWQGQPQVPAILQEKVDEAIAEAVARADVTMEAFAAEPTLIGCVPLTEAVIRVLYRQKKTPVEVLLPGRYLTTLAGDLSAKVPGTTAGAEWTRVSDLQMVTRALTNIGDGASAVVLTEHPTRAGHAFAATKTPSGVFWIDLQADTRNRITSDAPHRAATRTRATVLDPEGRVVENALLEWPPARAHTLAEDLLDPSPTPNQYGAIGVEIEYAWPLGRYSGKLSAGLPLAWNDTYGLRLVVDHKTFYRVTDGRLFLTPQIAEKKTGEKPTKQKEAIIEVVTDPMRVFNQEQRYPGRQLVLPQALRIRHLLSRTNHENSEILLRNLLPVQEGWVFSPEGQSVSVRPSPDPSHRAYTQLNVGVPIGGVRHLLELAQDRNGLDSLNDSLGGARAFAADVTTLYAARTLKRSITEENLPFLSEVRGLDELYGYAWLTFHHVAAGPIVTRFFRQRLTKNMLIVALRNSFHVVRRLLLPEAREFLTDYQTQIAEMFTVRLGQAIATHGARMPANIMDESFSGGATYRDYLMTAIAGKTLQGRRVTQGESVGVADMDVDQGDAGLPKVVLELRQFTGGLQSGEKFADIPHMDDQTISRTVGELEAVSREANALAQRFQDPRVGLTTREATTVLGHQLVRHVGPLLLKLTPLMAVIPQVTQKRWPVLGHSEARKIANALVQHVKAPETALPSWVLTRLTQVRETLMAAVNMQTQIMPAEQPYFAAAVLDLNAVLRELTPRATGSTSAPRSGSQRNPEYGAPRAWSVVDATAVSPTDRPADSLPAASSGRESLAWGVRWDARKWDESAWPYRFERLSEQDRKTVVRREAELASRRPLARAALLNTDRFEAFKGSTRDTSRLDPIGLDGTMTHIRADLRRIWIPDETSQGSATGKAGTWYLDVTLRLHLEAKEGVTRQTVETLEEELTEVTRAKLNAHAFELPSGDKLFVNPEFVSKSDNPHQIVSVHAGQGQMTATDFYPISSKDGSQTTMGQALHEFFHLLGAKDGYQDEEMALGRSASPSIMTHDSRFAALLSSVDLEVLGNLYSSGPVIYDYRDGAQQHGEGAPGRPTAFLNAPRAKTDTLRSPQVLAELETTGEAALRTHSQSGELAVPAEATPTNNDAITGSEPGRPSEHEMTPETASEVHAAEGSPFPLGGKWQRQPLQVQAVLHTRKYPLTTLLGQDAPQVTTQLAEAMNAPQGDSETERKQHIQRVKAAFAPIVAEAASHIRRDLAGNSTPSRVLSLNNSRLVITEIRDASHVALALTQEIADALNNRVYVEHTPGQKIPICPSQDQSTP